MSRQKTGGKGGALLPEDFREPVAETGGAGQADGGTYDERRREPRMPCLRRLAILPFHVSGRAWEFDTVELLDCSRGGLGLMSPQPMPVGSLFAAKLRLPKITLLVYVVRHCTPWNGRYKIGAELNGSVGGLEETPVDPATLLDTLLKGEPD